MNLLPGSPPRYPARYVLDSGREIGRDWFKFLADAEAALDAQDRAAQRLANEWGEGVVIEEGAVMPSGKVGFWERTGRVAPVGEMV